MKNLNFYLNGVRVNCKVRENELLLHMLREKLSVKSVKEGCSIGECGTCTVLIDDEPHYSCLTLASKVDGHDVKTVEFLGNADMLHPLQEAFIKYGAVQCGYCTPGMLLSAYSLLLKNKKPDRETIKEAISGNLCRCTGYVQIEEAIEEAAKARRKWEKENGKSDGGNGTRLRGTKQITSKREVLRYLDQHDDAMVVAGGTDLLIALRKGEVKGQLADITDVSELRGIEVNKSQIKIGATTTHAQISNDETVKRKAKSLSLACGWVGSPQIRNMGTIGGNLANASPAADSIPPLLIHDAMLTLESLSGKRDLMLTNFIVEPYKTTIRQDELLTSVTLKTLEGYREGYRRIAKRATWAIARLSVAWAIQEEKGVYKDVRVAIGSCTPMPFRSIRVEMFLKGRKKEKAVIDEAVQLILEEIKEISGIRPSFAYKVPVLRGILESTLKGQ